MEDPNLLAIATANPSLVEELYEQLQQNSKEIPSDWAEILRELEEKPARVEQGEVSSQDKIIDAYRKYGYLAVHVNPIEEKAPSFPKELEFLGKKDEKLVQKLKSIYTNKIGFEFAHCNNKELEKFIEERIEKGSTLTIDQKKKILQQLNKTELFENFLHTKFSGQKRFSIEGAETLIPMLSSVIEEAAIHGTEEVVVGMAHRGRLNVLVNILNKTFQEVFAEFDEGYIPDSFEGSGDVKYHKGFLSDIVTIHGHPVRITLTPNPSHLESVNAVVEGQVKGKQVNRNDSIQNKAIPILVHGDAALAGQGVVYETLQMYKLNGYSTGGTLHFVINNQVGFTTSPDEGRSTPFCTDIAKTFGFPVFHVNGEDPESCIFASLLALEIRNRFHLDVFIDLNCYRKWGHNETDEPFFTQPIEYKVIRKKNSIRELYRDYLLHHSVVEKDLAEKLESEFKKALADAQKDATKPKEKKPVPSKPNGVDETSKETGVSLENLKLVAKKLCEVPSGFSINSKIEHLLKDRQAMVFDNKPIDWGMGELLAYGTLLIQGTPLRLVGQDTARGTFSHRHGVWVDQAKGDVYEPLSHLKEGQGRADILNSPLSEYAALGFEYGYSLASPQTLVLWEAQFGDFVNGAQIVIDQYIASAEQKWGQKSSLGLLLPHGYEGQGPEHSSARLERFLSLCSHQNMFVCNPSTPAQMFHLLRRQILSGARKPLICLTPKYLLRHPECVSSIVELEKGAFQEVLDDPAGDKNAKVVFFCSGKIYYELVSLSKKENLQNVVFIRIEQLYPLSEESLKKIVQKYQKADQFAWVQEEPQNMGAWEHIVHKLKDYQLTYVGRKSSAAPASGAYLLHKKELAKLTEDVIALSKGQKL